MIHADSNIIEAVLSAIPEPFFVFDEEGHYVKIWEESIAADTTMDCI